MELSKSDKRAARAIIRKGLMAECERGLQGAAQIINDWKSGNSDPHKAYLDLYTHIADFDKGIAAQYDNLSNDSLIFALVRQLREGLLDAPELEGLSEEAREQVRRFLEWRE